MGKRKPMETIKVKANDRAIPNKMHFEVQLRTHANVFRNRKVYNRKQKHKGDK
jgi:hypothetical protein